MMTPEQQQVLFENTARAMGDAPEEINVAISTIVQRRTLLTAQVWQGIRSDP
jgi:hypothetical protein